ncbi:hypothetical protein GC207_06185 [bacterium]|nr:hypothetical protein [bacterium]
MSTKMKPPRWVVGCAVIGTAIHLTTAADFFANFSQPPAPDDWQIEGDPSLFDWNAAGHLDVTWDSSRTNSYFVHPLGMILGRDDDFKIAFDLTLKSISVGASPGKPDTFELAIGLINRADATSTNFFRGKGTGTVKNVFELDYFPDNGLGATVWPGVWSTNATLSYRDSNDYTLIPLPLSQVLHVEMTYTATNRTLRASIMAGGQTIGPINDLILSPTFTDYRVDSFAICSYSDAFTTGSLFATAEIDNVHLVTPPPSVENLLLVRTQNEWQLEFGSRTNWIYQAESTTDFDQWTSVGLTVEGTGEQLNLPAPTNEAFAFWRIRATRR